MDQKILSELGDYLLAHREGIIGEWLRAVEQNPDISSVDHLKDKEELLDHLPELCQNLAELLKSPQSNQNRSEVFRAARVHGRYRWRQGYSLEEEQTAPSLKEGIQMVRRNVELEVSLIDDLLDVARITGGKLQLHLQLSDAATLFRDALEMVKSESVRKQLEIRVELSATIHRVIVDRARIQQVFWNVLKNAQKFTPEGGTISVRSFNEGKEMVSFAITDSGKGIEPDLLPKIFETFQQGVGGPLGGLGLGLAISKAIIESHGGKIYASSKGSGTGATFTTVLKTA